MWEWPKWSYRQFISLSRICINPDGNSNEQHCAESLSEKFDSCSTYQVIQRFYDTHWIITSFKWPGSDSTAKPPSLTTFSIHILSFYEMIAESYLDGLKLVSHSVDDTVPHLCGISCHLMPSLNHSIIFWNIQILKPLVHFLHSPHTSILGRNVSLRMFWTSYWLHHFSVY
jgi:hypothetical protein